MNVQKIKSMTLYEYISLSCRMNVYSLSKQTRRRKPCFIVSLLKGHKYLSSKKVFSPIRISSFLVSKFSLKNVVGNIFKHKVYKVFRNEKMVHIYFVR